MNVETRNQHQCVGRIQPNPKGQQQLKLKK